VRWRARCAGLARRLGLLYAGGGGLGLGNLLMVGLRVDVRAVSHLRYPLSPGRHLRGAVIVRAALAGVPFTVAGTHLATDAVERPAQAALLAAELAATPGPLVLAADLNDVAGSVTWDSLAKGRHDAAGDDTRPTFPAIAPRARLDAIVVDPGVEVRSYDVVDTPAARRASDHLPVVADLTLPASS
jgi:endonuclease/exonuclease/phosphatase family metal-dependent hydrolase